MNGICYYVRNEEQRKTKRKIKVFQVVISHFDSLFFSFYPLILWCVYVTVFKIDIRKKGENLYTYVANAITAHICHNFLHFLWHIFPRCVLEKKKIIQLLLLLLVMLCYAPLLFVFICFIYVVVGLMFLCIINP